MYIYICACQSRFRNVLRIRNVVCARTCVVSVNAHTAMETTTPPELEVNDSTARPSAMEMMVEGLELPWDQTSVVDV